MEVDMREGKAFLDRANQFSGIDMVDWGEEKDEDFEIKRKPLKVLESKKLRKILMQGAKNQELPYIYQDQYQVYFICIQCKARYYAAGPICIKMLGKIELHRFYSDYGIDENDEKKLKIYTIPQLLAATAMIANELTGKMYTDEELLYGNNIIKEEDRDQIEREQVHFELQKGDDELYHHTYNEERKLLDCVKEGRVEDAIRYSMKMDKALGKMSSNELNHWKNVTIIAITLCTRAAIEGGLSPAIAYRLSDFYILKNDELKDIVQIFDNRNQAIKDLVQHVKKKHEIRKSSNYIERCKEYIERNYRQKIYIADVAKELGISQSYLSRLFHEITGQRFQDYIINVRVDRAANLLMYSDESIAKIAEYVNFPSQSYFGRVFKQYKKMSPKQFREAKKPTGF